MSTPVPALAVTSPLMWYSSRATGTVTLLLLTATVVLGILTATRTGPAAVPRFAVSDLHRRISLLAMCFLAVHILTAVLDTFVPVGLAAAVVPFTSHYSPFFIGVGAIAFDLLLAVVGTSLLRDHLPANAWRGVHWLVYASFPVAIVHTVGVGTDLKFGWMQVVTGACLAAVLVAVGWRLWASPHAGGATTARPSTRGPARPPTRAPAQPSTRGPARPPTPVRPVPSHRHPVGPGEVR